MILNVSSNGTACVDSDGTFPLANYCPAPACSNLDGVPRCLLGILSGVTTTAPGGFTLVTDPVDVAFHARTWADVGFEGSPGFGFSAAPANPGINSIASYTGPPLFDSMAGSLGIGRILTIEYAVSSGTYYRRVIVSWAGCLVFLSIVSQGTPFNCASDYTLDNDLVSGDIGAIKTGDIAGVLLGFFPMLVVSYGGTLAITKEACCICGCSPVSSARSTTESGQFPCQYAKITIPITDTSVQPDPFNLTFPAVDISYCAAVQVVSQYGITGKLATATMYRYHEPDADGNCKWWMEALYQAYDLTTTATLIKQCYLLFEADDADCPPLTGWTQESGACTSGSITVGTISGTPVIYNRLCPQGCSNCFIAYLFTFTLRTSNLTGGHTFTICMIDAFDYPGAPASCFWIALTDPTTGFADPAQGIVSAQVSTTINDSGDCVFRFIVGLDGTVNSGGHNYAGIWHFEATADSATHLCPTGTGWAPTYSSNPDADLTGHAPAVNSVAGGARCGCQTTAEGTDCGNLVATVGGTSILPGSCTITPGDAGGNAQWENAGCIGGFYEGVGVGMDLKVFCEIGSDGFAEYFAEGHITGDDVDGFYEWHATGTPTQPLCPTGLTWVLDSTDFGDSPILTVALP